MNPTSDDFSHSPAKPPGGGIRIVVQGLGEIPSFKNQKVMGRSRRGQPILYTKSQVKDQMERITRVIEFQLRCWLLTTGTETATECIPLSRIVSSLPLDDSLKWIGSHSVDWRKVKKGEEGFEILIDKL